MSDKPCYYDGTYMTCVKTGCKLEVDEKPVKIIDGEERRFVYNGDLFHCPHCGEFQLFGSGVPYYSPEKPFAFANGALQIKDTTNHNYCSVVGIISISEEQRPFIHKWYPRIEHQILWRETCLKAHAEDVNNNREKNPANTE